MRFLTYSAKSNTFLGLRKNENSAFKLLKSALISKWVTLFLLIILSSNHQYAHGNDLNWKKQDHTTSLFSRSLQSLQHQIDEQRSSFQKEAPALLKGISSAENNAASYSRSAMMECKTEFSAIDITFGTYVECGDAKMIGFSADVDTFSNIEATITFPSDFIYTGNVTGATIVSTSPLVLAPTIVDEAIDFSFDIQAQCDASDDGIINFDFAYTGGSSMCNQPSIAIPTDDVAISIAAPGTPGRNTESKIIAVLNEQDSLRTTIVQEGLGAIDSLFYFVDAHPLMTLDNVIDCSTGEVLNAVSTIGDRTFFMIGVNQVGADGLVRNEGVDICQLWTLHTCPSGVTGPISYGVSTSCTLDPTDICAEEMYETPIDFEGRQPQIVQLIDASIPYDPTCTDAPIQQAWRLINTGEAAASDIVINLDEKGGFTPIDMASFTYRIGASGASQTLGAGNILNLSGPVPGCVSAAYPTKGTDLTSRVNLTFPNVNLAAGETLFFSYNVYPTPCSSCSACDVQRRLGSEISAISVTDLCDNVVQSNLLVGDQAWPYFDVDMGSFMESPVSNCAGETSTLEVTVTNYTNTFINNQGHGDADERNAVYFNNGACTDCYLEISFELPNGLDWTGSGPEDFVWADDDGTEWEPDMATYTDNNGGVDILTVRWTGQPPSGFDAFAEASRMNFDYTPDCENELAKGTSCSPVLYDDTIKKTVTWSSGACASCTSEILQCEEAIDVTIKCPGMNDMCMCDGFVQTYADAARANLYDSDPNNDGIPDVGSPYDENLVRTDRFLKGDSIEVNMGGFVSANDGFTNFDYLYAIVEFPNAEFLPIGGIVTIYEAGGSTYTCNVLTQQISGNELITDLSIANLTANGCTVPTTYEHLDSVALTFYYTATEEFNGNLKQLRYTTRFFASDQPYGGTEYSCRLPYDFRLSQVGLQSEFAVANFALNNFGGCDTGTPLYSGYSRIGDAFLDYFPGEYIGNVETISKFEANIPTGLVLNYFRVFIRKKNTNNVYAPGSEIPGFGSFVQMDASHPSLTILGNQLSFDMETFLIEETGNSEFPYSDEGYNFILQPWYIGTCDLVAGALEDVTITTEHVTNADLFCSSGYTDTRDVTGLNYTGGAQIEISVVNACIEANQFPSCATIQIVNTGSVKADNVWFTFNSPSGRAVFQNLSTTGPSGTQLSPTDFNMFEIGDLNAGATLTFDLCMAVNTCELDSLEVLSGYDCMSYPSVLEEAICSSNDFIFYKPVTGALSMTVKEPAVNFNSQLCDTIEYVVDLNASGPGFLHNIFTDIHLPPNTHFVPGSFELAYVTDATPATLPAEHEYEPASDPVHLYGNSYHFDVSFLRRMQKRVVVIF